MQLFRHILILALVLAAGLLPAQTAVRVGRVRGLVVDSLLGAVLPGATVRIVQSGRATQTDSTGRFVIDSVPPGDWVVAFRHPALDSLGYGDISARVRVFAGASATVTLATPSFESFRLRLCADTPDSLTSTVAFGGVRADDGSRVRVDVAVTWLSVEDGGKSPRAGTVRTVPDGGGQMWLACGIPWRAWIHASVRDSLRVASAYLQLGERGIAVHELVLSGGVADVAGTVRDDIGNALEGARISVTDTDVAAVSDRAGSFVLRGVTTGTMTLDVRAAGFRPWVAPLMAGAGPPVIRLQPLIARDSSTTRGSDYLRLLERSSRAGVALLAGAALTADSAALETLLPSTTCRWWLDGRPVERDFFLAQPRWSWRALEVYAHGTDATPEYRSAGCAVALLWTAASDW